MILPQVHLRKPCYDFVLPLNDKVQVEFSRRRRRRTAHVAAILNTSPDHSIGRSDGRLNCSYLHMHGLIFETAYDYWQDQPARTLNEGKNRIDKDPTTHIAFRIQETNDAPKAMPSLHRQQQYGPWRALQGMQHRKPPDAQGKQSLVALLKRYARVEVAAQADIQPPVTNQTPLMHLYGRHPRRPSS
ncbi:hypothetical protein L2E82_52094 [Cichorium intybus]|nr:hypothetical protein L2E82_52094 [Cichorium intybus]